MIETDKNKYLILAQFRRHVKWGTYHCFRNGRAMSMGSFAQICLSLCSCVLVAPRSELRQRKGRRHTSLRCGQWCKSQLTDDSARHFTGRVQAASDAEVSEFHVASRFVEKNVLGLDVAVQNVAVRV